MKALNYVGPFNVKVQEVEMPRLEHPDDIIVKVTSAAICGSDLHMYEGRTAAEAGITFGHENLGIVEELGDGVTLLKKGDRVVMPFNVADGRCRNCEDGKTAFCTGVNPGFAGGAYGYVAMGPYRGGMYTSSLHSNTPKDRWVKSTIAGQAQYLRVPYADFNALKLPPGTEHEADFILLADIFPTGWHGIEISGFQPGDTVAVFGAGPVGLMAAYSAQLRGASRVFVVDRVPERLRAAEKIGAVPIDFTAGDAVDQIIAANGGELVDRSVDAVGYQAVSGKGDNATEVPNIVLENMIKVTRACVTPALVTPQQRRGLTLGTGQCNVKAYNRQLRDLIIAGKAKPSFVVSHEISIDEAEVAYDKFDKRVDGYTKVIIHPNGGFQGKQPPVVASTL
ncbi:glutathione-independent formaldehyde dehydrogenase [Aspergillus mulundensis]|uniref:Alcohol dehydrogenase n=1 Tax=Aspergillus mulundensis TaxID=1810919 RepID=A0A3D8QHB0_9EURO|nr:Uncharacterized protein DSM5745_10724 [Aspergillus mulundensis]RDW61226.1 Uncharacterized protein DSM5745_10724 [Aspergillus mulundensis]